MRTRERPVSDRYVSRAWLDHAAAMSAAAAADRAAEACEVAGAGLIDAHRCAQRPAAAREAGREDRRRVTVEPAARDRAPVAVREPALQLHDSTGKRARACDVG